MLADVSSKLMGQFVENLERDVLSTAGGGDTTHAGGPYEEALASASAELAADAQPIPSRPVAAGPRKIDSPEAEPVDLMQMAGNPLAKRVVPIVIVTVTVVVIWRIRRRRRRNS